MPSTDRLRILYFSYLSKPAADQLIYRAIYAQRARKILELGMGTGRRAMRMIEIARFGSPDAPIEYIAVDPFEARSAADGPGVSLKRAHRMLCETGARIHLVPGDPLGALSRTANALGQVDLLAISSQLDPKSMSGAWFYVPRLLHASSKVFLETLLPLGKKSMRMVERSEIDNWATATTRRRAA